MSRDRLPVAVLGATGSVGQRFLVLLADHPWFEPVVLTASDRSTGLPYRDAVRWMQTTPIPPALADRVLAPTAAYSLAGCRIAFSALDAAVAGPVEDEIARAGLLVVSNTKSHRMDEDVPLLVPEVNGDHLALAGQQGRGTGAILTNPNCSTIGLVLALKPLDDAFGVETAHVVTMQAVSGAGIPGVSSMQAIDNVIPFIGGEEEKIEIESRKILGRLRNDRIEPHPIRVSAACNRVSVIDGHTLCVSVGLREKPDLAAVRAAWEAFPGLADLPSAPARPVIYLEGDDVPQPRLHRDFGNGMSATVGRLRPCPLFDFKFVVLSHNTVRGAAGGAVLVAEMATARGAEGDVAVPPMADLDPRYPTAEGWTWAFAPGTVSNVGCGFDVLGFAVEGPGDRVGARRGSAPGIRIVAVEGDGGVLPRDPARNTAGVVARALLDATGCDCGVELVIHKGMPLASGLGSSAASGVAAAVAVDAALGLGASRDLLLRAAVEGERVACGSPHPDNAAPSLWGGFVLVRPGDAGPVVTPLPVPAGLCCALVRPHVAVETGPSRALLGDRVPLAAAVRQWGNVGALVAALFRGDLELLASALHDAVAEPVRGPLIPGFAAVKAAALDAGALGCSLSGSGPSIFALAGDREAADRALAAMKAALAGTGLGHDGFVTPVGAAGARLVS